VGGGKGLVLALDVLYNSAACEILVPLWEAVLVRINGEIGLSLGRALLEVWRVGGG
jgi:hypothetical protein